MTPQRAWGPGRLVLVGALVIAAVTTAEVVAGTPRSPASWAAEDDCGATTTTTVASSPNNLAAEGGDFEAPVFNALQNSTAGDAAVAPLNNTWFQPNVDLARCDFADDDGAADYIVSEYPLTSAEATTAASKGRSFAYVPFAVSGVAISALLECNATTTLTSSTLCPDLQMTAEVAAQAFGGHVSTWSDPVFAKLSAGKAVTTTSQSNAITRYNQIDPSMDNQAVQQYLLSTQSAATVWDAYQSAFHATPGQATELWPTDSGVQGINTILADMVPNNPATNLPETNPELWMPGSIAPLPFDWLGAPYNMPTVALQNAAGAYVSPTVASLTAALAHATMDTTTNLVTFGPSTTDTAAYPIPVMSYLVVPTSGLAQAKATALASFVRYLLSAPAQKAMATYDTAPPTPAMVSAGLHVADLVALQQGNSPTTTTTTTTTPSGGVTTTTSAGSGTKPAGKSGSSGDSGADLTGAGRGVANSSASNGASSTASSGSSLALTGGPPWPLPVLGGGLLVVGAGVRRLVRRRLIRTRGLVR